MARPKSVVLRFADQAARMMALPVAHPVGDLGGYGPGGEVIYTRHPAACPSVLVDSQGPAKATFMSNGSVELGVHIEEVGMDVSVLDGSFENVAKREIAPPSQNLWVEFVAGGQRRVASLINPNLNMGCPTDAIRIVKLGDPGRAMWYGATFCPVPGVVLETAVRLALVTTDTGPALLRQAWLHNAGRRKVSGNLWGYFNLHGTQRFVYNKDLWYDAGLPVSLRETVVAARVPYSDLVQIKRVSSVVKNLRAVDATCDYAAFVGDSAALSLMPAAVVGGAMLGGGAGRKLNRFTTATIAANQFGFELAAGASATLEQSLLYVLDEKVAARFRRANGCNTPRYREIAGAFKQASSALVEATPGVRAVAAAAADPGPAPAPDFEVGLPGQPVAAMYANSAWSTVQELYENCRAHGAKMAEGIELGTRDRGQDMWPKMKQDPGRVRADLVHALGFMYVTCDRTPRVGAKPLTLVQKLHGMWPRQFPSRWDHRDQAVLNDNRPYTDSPLWLIDALNMYLRETGDVSILGETVPTIRLTDPADPIQSGIVGGDRTQSLLEAALEALACFQRHTEDSPYGLAQILYGDWCDPVDMFGTRPVGDPATRGVGRGAQVRLSQHLFVTLVETIATLETPAVAQAAALPRRAAVLRQLKPFADRLRKDILKWAWEDTGKQGFAAGFVDAIHELKANGRKPDYRRGQTGYTLGSMTGRDFDGIRRRVLCPQAWGLAMLAAEADYLSPVPGVEGMIRKLLKTVDDVFYHRRLGLQLFVPPVANNQQAIDRVGRLGVLPAGCGENGEYHHGQMFMHRFRLDVPGQADAVWKQFAPMMSAMRDVTLAGPFETPATSYVADRTDPHFGKGMYFGLSGSIGWIVQSYQRLAGLELNLLDDRVPDVRVDPALPGALGGAMTLRRILHVATGAGTYRKLPVTVQITRGAKKGIRINGKPAAVAQVQNIGSLRRLEIEMIEGSR